MTCEQVRAIPAAGVDRWDGDLILVVTLFSCFSCAKSNQNLVS